ncbi:MAG: DHH family phosphoesterase [Bacilli bacterium]|nr:DHH family phosphoesterase [Bacilli bacterium]
MADIRRSSKRNSVSMTDALRSMRIVLIILTFLEIAGLAAAIVLYFLDFPTGIQAKVKPQYWIFAMSLVVVVNLLLLWISISHMSTLRHKTDLDAASIIGSDVQEAYNFGEIGLVVTDDRDVVIWDNNLLKDRQVNLLDMNILEWQPALKDLKTAPADMVVKIEANGRNYNVKYLADARLYIFKDTSEYESIFTYSRVHATVVGVIMIDNFTEIVGKTEDENNDLVTTIRQEILNYCKEKGVLLRRFRNDSYFAVCNYASLEKMEEDGFSLLNRVRALGRGQNIAPTLSIGFAHDFPNVIKLNEMASSAIDMAMSRGGDQAVVSRYGDDIKFYGGKTAALENSSAVKFRTNADAILNIINDSKEVLVMGHNDMDMDALGACIGVYAMCLHLKKPCYIIIDHKRTEKKTRGAFLATFDKETRDRIALTPRQAEEHLQSVPGALLAVVDVSVPANVMAPKALEKANKIIVVDHHLRGESYLEKPVFEYIDPSASSASEIFAEFIHYASGNPRIEIPSNLATTMLSGIFLDTGFFKSNSVGVRTFEAAEVLREFGADPRRADDFLKDEYEEYLLVNKIASTMKSPARGVVYAVCDESDIIDRATLAKVANTLMRLRDIHAAFVIGKVAEREWRISARSDQTINVMLLCEKMGGGGHFTASACGFQNSTLALVEGKLLSTLETYLNDARADTGGN